MSRASKEKSQNKKKKNIMKYTVKLPVCNTYVVKNYETDAHKW